ncbi:hypothetical protein PT226_05610, partial [Erysipelothrix rhusiopathiae]|nr:hypothetical protein [Erysipelothrix rhusiopathiae]
HILEEGAESLVEDFNKNELLRGLCTIDSKKIYPNFVGFVISNNELIVSFPKKYDTNGVNLKEINELAKLLLRNSSNLSDTIDGQFKGNFPLRAYLSVCKYFTEYGFYKQKMISYQRGKDKKVDWKKTFSESEAIINDDNIIFLPLILKKSISTDVFLTECMKIVLSEGYQKFGVFFSTGVPYRHVNISNDYDYNYIVTKLKTLLTTNNNDSTKKLIMAMIDFIQWLNNASKDVFFVTTSFSVIWQKMVHEVLCKCLHITSNEYFFDFKNRASNSIQSEVSHDIQSQVNKATRNFSVRFDHLFMNDHNIYLFDSKYMITIDKFDYKQFAYNYMIKDWIYRSQNKKNMIIHNALILPCSKEDYTKLHLDTTNEFHHEMMEDIIIKEHYFEMKKVIKWYLLEIN